jgi:hypothetical protein
MSMRTSRSFSVALVVQVSGCYLGVDAPREFRVEPAEEAFPGIEPEGVAKGWFAVEGQMREVEYSLINGWAVVEGDIVVGRASELSAIERGETTPPRSAANPDALWPGGEIPYVLDASLTDAGRAAVEAAVAHWNANTAVRVVERTTQVDHVRFVGGSGCSSSVGRRGGAQDIVLGEGCGPGQAIHEIGHAAGLWHEQSRADRDANIIVHWEQIDPDRTTNFRNYVELGNAGVDLGAYDLGSIMHYGSFFFAIGDEPTITRPDGGLIEAQREALSAGDLQGIAALYGAPGGGGEGVGGGEGGGGGPSGCGALLPGEVLESGEWLESCDGRFGLVMQEDGNLVLYAADGVALWHTVTYGHPGSYLAMQDDGNLVVYEGGTPLWWSGTGGH